jgi:hypothetical protein
MVSDLVVERSGCDLPSGAVNVSWYLLCESLGNLYPSQKT